MLGIMKKDFFRIVFVPNLTFIGLALLVWFETSGEYDASMALTTSAWIILFVFGGIIGVKQYESKFNGYRFMSTLPVTAKDIFGGKSVLVVVSLLIMGFGYYVTFSPLIMEPSARNTLQNLVVVNSALVLVLVGLVYLTVAKVGFSRFYGPLWAVIILIG
ncbi:MAG: hypothetical protein KAX16_06555, partial [Actinomycetia bacterium]|nr:hypothetical protein [Actinomycetes bacterium]